MPTAKQQEQQKERGSIGEKHECYHCGISCNTSIAIDDKVFCCEGCKLVYELLDDNGLCDYYKLQSHPGLTQIKALRNDKYAYLDNEEIAKRLYKFTDGKNVITTLYIPGIHCASCMWLLEHMYKLNEGITESRLNFSTKELTVHFNKEKISIRQIVELMATIGYEPYISLEDADGKKGNKADKSKIYKLGIAGFCFGNIMMMSFPEYLSDKGIEHQYVQLFRMLNLALALPVFFYSASEFFVSAWKGLKQKMLNIDAPVVLALIITFTRSLYEILTNTGGGYLDSMSGIVFFMLIGRVVQDRAYRSISFHRDYKAYFPIAVNVVTENGVVGKSLQDLKEKDVVQLYSDELIPADALIVKGTGNIDYSFVTGESEPVTMKEGDTVYAGGRQTGGQLTIQVIKPVAGSYLTSLWNHHAFSNNKIKNNQDNSTVHLLSRYFTYILFTLAAATAIYWWITDPSKILPSVSAMLIIACPCALLLAATYTDGNILRLLSVNGLFLRDASVIEQIGKIDHIVFDKTGTLTQGHKVTFNGSILTNEDKAILYTVTSSSRHPYSQAIAHSIAEELGTHPEVKLTAWQEIPGKGIVASTGDLSVRVGSSALTEVKSTLHNNVYIRIGSKVAGVHIEPAFRRAAPEMIGTLKERYELSLLSGDNDQQSKKMRSVFGKRTDLLFNQQPVDKLKYIEQLQSRKKSVLMIGDGLNDAGALQQSNVGITLADDINNFTPSCDAILDANKFSKLPALLRLARSARQIVNFSFFISILYNIVGLFIAVQGLMSPMIAAILMPLSTISIVLLTTGLSSISAKNAGLRLHS